MHQQEPFFRTEKDWKDFQGETQGFIESSGARILMVCVFPDGRMVQFCNKGMTSMESLGMIEHAKMDLQAGHTLIRLAREEMNRRSNDADS